MTQKPQQWYSLLENQLEKLAKRPARFLLYGTVMAAIAHVGGAHIPPELVPLVTGVGINLLSSMVERVAAKGDLSEDDLDELQRTVEADQLSQLLTEDRFHRDIAQLVRHIDLENRQTRDLIVSRLDNEVIARLKRIEAALITSAKPKPSSCNFVPNPEHFVGRADELAALRSTLSTDGAVTAITALKGIGGIGKTTLACAYANQDERFKLKLYASLGQNYRENMESTVMEIWIGGDFHFPPGTPLDQMIATTQQKLMASECSSPVLLLIDDVWADTVNAARNLRTAAPPNARVLITTRSEQVRLKLGAKVQALDYFSPEHGAELIIDLVGEHVSKYRSELEALSQTLGGHALALTLAARQVGLDPERAWINSLRDQYQHGIDNGDEFSALQLDEGDTPIDSVRVSLLRTLNALGGSDIALNETRQKQFRALGVLPPELAFRDKHAFALWESEDRRALVEFVAEGLINRDGDREGWYTQHRLLRAYARAQLRTLGELGEAEANHRDYLIKLADAGFNKPPETWWDLTDDLEQIHALGNDLAARLAGTTDPDEQDERLRRMSKPKSEDDSVETRHTSSSALPVPDDPALLAACDRFANAVYHYIFGRYVGAEGRRWLWAGLAAAGARESQRHIGLFTGALGNWNYQRGMKQQAFAYYEQSLEVSRAQGDKLNEAAILNSFGTVWNELGDNAEALNFFQQVLLLIREVGDKRGEATTLNNIGLVWDDLGDKHKALYFFGQALPLRREVGDKRGEAATLNNLGLVWDDLGDKHKALSYYWQALPLMREIGDIYGEATTLGNIALILWEQGDRATALEYMQTARTIKARIGISTEDEDYWLNQWQSEMGGE